MQPIKSKIHNSSFLVLHYFLSTCFFFPSEDCNKQCETLAAKVASVSAINMIDQYPQAALEEKICSLFCDLNSIRKLAAVSNRVRRSTRGMIFGRPFRRPKDYQSSKACRKCEAKRSSCFKYYLWTYGICGAAYALGGSIASTGCNVVTLPRTGGKIPSRIDWVNAPIKKDFHFISDCTLNTLLNCYMKRCGLVGI